MTEGGPTVAHILHSGYPLCEFSAAWPRDWPSGHVWVSKAEWQTVDRDVKRILCRECVRVANDT